MMSLQIRADSWFANVRWASSLSWRLLLQENGSQLGVIWVPGMFIILLVFLSMVRGTLSGLSFVDSLAFVATGMWVVFAVQRTLTGRQIGYRRLDAGSALIGKSPPFPYIVSAIQAWLGSILVTPLILILVLVAGHSPRLEWLVSILLMTLLVPFLVSLSVCRGLLVAYWQNSQRILNLAGTLLLFVSPVFWSPTNAAGTRSALATYNPLAYFIEGIRTPFGFSGPFSLEKTLAVAGATTLVLGGVAFAALRAMRNLEEARIL